MKFWLVFLALFLASCSDKFTAPKLENFNQKEFIVVDENRVNRLFVSNQNGIYRFVMIDTFGMPLADKELVDSEFKNLKFLRPNSDYNQLFLEILELLSKNTKEATIKIDNKIYKVKNVS